MPGQRATAHLSAPGGLFSFAKPIVAVVNSVAGVPAEFRATQVSVHAALTCALLALAALFAAALTGGMPAAPTSGRSCKKKYEDQPPRLAPEPSPEPSTPETKRLETARITEL